MENQSIESGFQPDILVLLMETYPTLLGHVLGILSYTQTPQKAEHMDSTPNLFLPFILPSQAQKHVTHNEGLRTLDAIVQLSVLDWSLTTPPVSPLDGDRHLVATGAISAWSGHDAKIAAWQDGAWTFYAPQEGWLCWVTSESSLLVWDGAAWSEVSQSNINPVPLVGVNAVADSTNRLAVSAPGTLFTHQGSDHRIAINKAAMADTASFVFQDDFAGCAEIGLIGDDNFRFKVSPDGAIWRDAIIIDRETGAVSFPYGPAGDNVLINGDFAVNQREFTGGALIAGDYGFDRWKADTGGADLTLGAGIVTLNSGSVVQVIEAPGLAGQTITVSVDSLSGGNLSIEIEGETAEIVPGSGRRSVSITVPLASAGDIALKLAPVSSAVTFSKVKMEVGTIATLWQPRHLQTELLLCYRYFQRHTSAAYAETGGGHVVNSTIVRVRRPYHAPMRAIPSFSSGGSLSDFAAYYNGEYHALTLSGFIGATEVDTALTFTGADMVGNNSAAVRQQAQTSYFEFSAEL